MSRTRAILLLCALASVGAADLAGQEQKLLEIRNLEPRGLRADAFTLDAPAELRLTVIGAEPGGLVRFHRTRSAIVSFVRNVLDIGGSPPDQPWAGNAWILNSATREVMWELASAPSVQTESGLRTYTGKLSLPAGTYEVYYGTWQPRVNDWELDDGAARRLSLQLHGTGVAFHAVTPELARRQYANAVLAGLGGTADAPAERVAFTIQRPIQVEPRLLPRPGARAGREHAWIMDLNTRGVLWSYQATNPPAVMLESDPTARSITLPPGRYAAFYIGDASRSSSSALRPVYDPAFAGLTLYSADPAARSAFQTLDYEPVTPANIIVSLARQGDNANNALGFTLRRPMDVHVFALGEASGGRMVDWGRIVEARSRRPVWTMNYEDTRGAGGAAKNRLFDQRIRLAAGDYIVQYITDDSHAYDAWNSAAPLDPEYWGITVASAAPLDRNSIAAYDEATDPAILARIAGVRDGQQVRRRFTLKSESDIHIYALGEGDDNAMFDYARIVDAAGNSVWQMHPRNTTHAGGARKNRLFNGAVRLPAGEYEVIYRTDDSHAFGDWNADPPTDPRGWGITIYR
jgi:hypothetical protein